MLTDNKSLEALTFTESAERLQTIETQLLGILADNHGKMKTDKLLSAMQDANNWSANENKAALSLAYSKRLLDIDDREQIVSLHQS